MTTSEHTEFDPARHPLADVESELASKLYRAQPNTHIAFPDKTAIHKTEDGHYHIHNRAGHIIGRHGSDEDKAARHMLDLQVQSHHRFSIDGTRTHSSFAHYKKFKGAK